MTTGYLAPAKGVPAWVDAETEAVGTASLLVGTASLL